MTAPVVERLDTAAARRLVSEARNALAVADDLLARLFAGRAWEALGHADWDALCAAELPELRHLKMRPAARLARVAALDAVGATTRQIAVATGASVGQAHADRAKLRAAAPADDIESRPGAGGPIARPVCAATGAAPAHVVVAGLVAAAGARGLTIPQAQRRTGWTYGATSGALSRAERRGLVHRPAHLDPRGGFRPYVALG